MRTEGERLMPFLFPSASSCPSPEEVWTTAFNELSRRIKRYFGRQEPYHRAQTYVRGLMSSVERKNGWQVAEEVGEATPYAIQHLLDRAKWDADGVRNELRAYVCEALVDPHAILIIDETGFLKKGTKSAGVQRQYSGTAGRTENCQVGVFLAYASPKGHALIDRELYLPKSWTQDPERGLEAHVPRAITFATKPALAVRMLQRALDSGLSVAWITGDTVYGSNPYLRATLETRRQAYALAVSCQEHVDVVDKRVRVDDLAHERAREEWQRHSVGNGAKGPRQGMTPLSFLTHLKVDCPPSAR